MLLIFSFYGHTAIANVQRFIIFIQHIFMIITTFIAIIKILLCSIKVREEFCKLEVARRSSGKTLLAASSSISISSSPLLSLSSASSPSSLSPSLTSSLPTIMDQWQHVPSNVAEGTTDPRHFKSFYFIVCLLSLSMSLGQTSTWFCHF